LQAGDLRMSGEASDRPFEVGGDGGMCRVAAGRRGWERGQGAIEALSGHATAVRPGVPHRVTRRAKAALRGV